MEEFKWLIEKAKLVAMGAILSGDIEAIRELNDFLDSFARRQQDKLTSKKANSN